MTTRQLNYIIDILIKKGLHFENGLTNDEIFKIENKFNFRFPPDLKLFLQTVLPISDSFINWRKGLNSKDETDKIISRLDWPLEGMLFDIQSNNFWVDNWGSKPDNEKERTAIVKQQYAIYPKLIPIYLHRYIPSEPCEMGNPVFSVYQMDIIYYGYDLATYFAKEFHFDLPAYFEIPEMPREIKFWNDWAG